MSGVLSDPASVRTAAAPYFDIMSPRFNKTAELPPGVLARAKARGLRRLAGMVSDEDRDAAEAAIELADAERAAVAASRMADFESKRPGQKMFAGVRGRVASAGQALAGIKSRVMSALGLTSSPVASKAPVVNAQPAASWSKLTITADSTPQEVENAMASLLAKPGADESQADLRGRLSAFQSFLSAVGQVDPSGRIIELVDLGSDEEKRHAARVVGGILAGILPAGKPSASVATASKPTTAPMGLSGVQASIEREIAGTRTKSVATPPSAKPVPSVASPVTGGTLSSRLTGTARAEASIRESLGQKPLAEHVHLANKLNPETISK